VNVVRLIGGFLSKHKARKALAGFDRLLPVIRGGPAVVGAPVTP
jgi:hypothetical protein